MAILRFVDGQATQLVHIDGLEGVSGGSGATITSVTVNMLDADGTASGSTGQISVS